MWRFFRFAAIGITSLIAYALIYLAVDPNIAATVWHYVIMRGWMRSPSQVVAANGS